MTDHYDKFSLQPETLTRRQRLQQEQIHDDMVQSGKRDKANSTHILLNQGGTAQRRGGRSQTKGWVDGVQRVPLAAPAERGARGNNSVLKVMPS